MLPTQSHIVKLAKSFNVGPLPESVQSISTVSPAVYVVLRVGFVNLMSASARGSAADSNARERVKRIIGLAGNEKKGGGGGGRMQEQENKIK